MATSVNTEEAASNSNVGRAITFSVSPRSSKTNENSPVWASVMPVAAALRKPCRKAVMMPVTTAAFSTKVAAASRTT